MRKINYEAFLTPVAIVLGSLFISGAILMKWEKPAPSPAPANSQPETINIAPVTSKDHIFGNPNAKTVIVEYSDTECPFCKKLHSTLHEVLASHEKTGDVAWVFRYFPVHRKSVTEASAQECAAELGGNEAFWKFTDKVFSETNSNDSLDPSALPRIAGDIGLDVTKFNSCISSGKYASKIEGQLAEARSSGAKGTPWSVIISNNRKVPVGGAVSLENIEKIIENVSR